MSKSKELLLECKIKLGIKTDYKLAKALKIDRARVSEYMLDKRKPDTFSCVQIALILNRDPTEIIAIVESESEKNEKRRTFWLDFLLHAKQAARLGMLALIFTTSALSGGNSLDQRSGFSRRRYFA